MTKRKKNLTSQPTLFDLIRDSNSVSSPMNFKGGLDIDAELRAALSEDLRHAVDERGRDLSRAEVAARMSDFTGQEITLAMLHSWTAEAHKKHRFPAVFLPALCPCDRRPGADVRGPLEIFRPVCSPGPGGAQGGDPAAQ